MDLSDAGSDDEELKMNKMTSEDRSFAFKNIKFTGEKKLGEESGASDAESSNSDSRISKTRVIDHGKYLR